MASRRALLVAGLVAMLALGLSACGGDDTWTNADLPHDAPSGGQTRAELTAAIEALPGLTSVEIGGWEPNVKGNVGVSLRLRIAPEYTIADGPSLMTYLVESAWSVREGYMPNSSIRIAIHSSAEDPFDGPAAARDAGWLPEGSDLGRFNPTTGYSVTDIWLPGHDGVRADAGLGAEENLNRLGSWPGPPPSAPADLIVQRR